ncbi:RHS repeat-associated core domain-containing protein, partial [Candidatus Pacearchaeota archaeon]|nr:RHS repeat-associated core domain-containing protein [Candidatus Pacearchaeota archaeon]
MKTKSCILSAFYILFIILSGIYVSAYQSNNETTLYVSDSFVVVINSSGQFNYTYYYLNNQLLGAKAPDGTKTYYHSDHLGSTTLVTNQSGDIVEENFYEPFGQIYSGEEENRYLYTGQELDQDTDLYYYGARYYDPSKNQFVQPDPLIQDIYTPADLNRYAYVRNNPYKYTDP